MQRLRLPLDVFGARSPYRLTGGEARRLSLACTLVRHPGLLVLDEPTFGQDRRGYDGLLEILRERLDDGACLIVATHDERLVDGHRVTGGRARRWADRARPRSRGGLMIVARDLAPAQLDSPLGRTSPVLKLAIAVVWFVGLATTTRFLPPLVIAGAAVGSAFLIARIPPGDLARAVAPVWLAALGLALFNTLFAAANADPSATTVAQLGPLRVTVTGLAGGVGLGLRLIAIGAVGAVFVLTTDSTRLADSLVQQAGVSPRFAYGALAAYQAVPRFGEDLTTLRQARRLRGLRGGWHPRLLVGLLVLAIRHGDRVALAMDARAFGSGPRTHYREVRWGGLDVSMGLAAVAILVLALALGT